MIDAKRIVVALSLALCMAQLPAVEVVQNVMILSSEDMEHCEEGGGCKVITNKKLGELLKRAQCGGSEA